MTSVTIAGSPVEQVVSVEATKHNETQLDRAVVEAVDTGSNRGFAPDEPVSVSFDGATFNGDVTGQPSQSGGRLSFIAHGELLAAKHNQVYRVFYNEETSDAVQSLATERSEQLAKTLIHTADTPGDWDSTAPVAEPYGGNRVGLYNFGTDLLFIGAREGYSNELRTTYQSVPSAAIEAGIFELRTRLILTDLASVWDLVIELKTPDGTSYRWEPEIRQGAHTYVLRAEEAEPEDSGLSAGQLRYRLIPSGIIAEPVGMLIDHAATIPFRLQPRTDPIPIDDIQPSDRTITRRIDASVGRAISELARWTTARFRGMLPRPQTRGRADF